MSKWAVYKDDEQLFHVAPCSDSGELLEPHELKGACACQPKYEGGWVHNDEERGGFNA